MARFTAGQKIVCINNGGWCPCDAAGRPVGENSWAGHPKYKEVCTVTGYENGWACLLEGYSQVDGYDETLFEPLSTMGESREWAKEQIRLIEEEINQPVYI